MINAGFFKEENGYRVIICGHANYAPEGYDIVCAAVSTLFNTLLAYLRSVRGSRCKVIKIEKGYAELTCGPIGEEAVRMACMGILQVSEQYPQHVTLHNKIWRSRLGSHAMGEDIFPKSADTATPSRGSGDIKGECIHERRSLFGYIRGSIRKHIRDRGT